jgi:hypothetical protein
MMKAAKEHLPVLTLATQDLKGLLHLLESGVRLTVRVGTSLADLVCDQIGIPRDYLDGRIQTLFLNAKAVDDVNTARVEDGAVVALSAAMPGLVGATLRKGGAFSGLRAAISQKDGTASQYDASGAITLKMFNLVAREVGPDLLTRGVQLPGNRLGDFLNAAAPSDLTIRQGAQPLTIQAAAALCARHSWICVQLEK